jgi:hypothetical protein
MDSRREEPIPVAGEESAVRQLTRRQRDAAVIGWASFLCAAAASVLLFAFVDPADLGALTDSLLDVSRMTGYALGFFFLWLLAAASAALTVYLIRTRRGHRPQP